VDSIATDFTSYCTSWHSEIVGFVRSYSQAWGGGGGGGLFGACGFGLMQFHSMQYSRGSITKVGSENHDCINQYLVEVVASSDWPAES
jgi:formiminotetrahydrofolate cyclodeaminase